MSKGIYILIFGVLGSFTITDAQSYSSGAGGSFSTCSGTFYDAGGTSSYGNSQNYTTTFCPSTAGQCIKVVFSSFDLEDGFDFLSVYDGNSTSAPMIQGSSFSATAPTTLTATNINTTGCLTFKFVSDGGTTASGWQANISCGSCAASPTSALQQDCQGANTICNNQSVSGTSLGSGNFNDVNSGLGNLGCLNDYGATPDGSGEHQSHWYYFSPSASGTIGMTIAPNSSSTDYDWAIWGPYTTIPCPPTGAPLRCSASAASNSTGGQTGMGNGASDTGEGSSGNGWVSTISVTAGQKYVLFLDNWNATSAPYTLSWQLSGGASLACMVLPIELVSFTGTDKAEFNLLEWSTASETDNDYFTLERSSDGANWLAISTIKGAGNSAHTINYHFEDYTYANGAINYYRLKQTNFNKTYKYSSIINIENQHPSKKGIYSVYPVPSFNKLNIDFIATLNTRVGVSIFSLSGNEVLTQEQLLESGKQTITVNTEMLSQGLYLIKITDYSSSELYYSKFTKN